jgi:hypothetical protein
MIHRTSDIFRSAVPERVAMRLAAMRKGHFPNDARSRALRFEKAVKRKLSGTRRTPLPSG